MKLKQLQIRRKDKWEDANRSLIGSIWFESTTGEEIKILIDEATSSKIVEMCAQGIANAASDLSQIILDDIKCLPPPSRLTPLTEESHF